MAADGALAVALAAARADVADAAAALAATRATAATARRARDDAVGARYVLAAKLADAASRKSDDRRDSAARLVHELASATSQHERIRSDCDLVESETEILSRDLVDLKLELAMASEKSEDIRDEISAGEGYSRRLKDELMHRGIMPCTSPAYKGDAPPTTLQSILSRFSRRPSPAKTGGGESGGDGALNGALA